MTRQYMEIDEEALVGIEALQRGATVAEAEAAIEAAGHRVDFLPFVRALQARGLASPADGTGPAPGDAPAAAAVAAAPAAWAWLHGPALWALCIGLSSLWAWQVLSGNATVPGRDALAWSGASGASILLAFGAFVAVALLHELAHKAMAESYGVRAPIRASHRSMLFVLHTDVSNAWMLGLRPRIAIFSAGILLNVTLAAAAGLVSEVARLAGWGWPDPAHHALQFVQVVNLLPVAFQFLFLARTDLYQVAAAILGERNLAQDARGYLRFRWERLWARRRRSLWTACLRCGGSCYLRDPFCFACGAPRQHQHARPLPPFEHRSRHRLLAWGVVQAAWAVLLLGVLVLLAFPAIQAFLARAIANALHDWGQGHRAQALAWGLGALLIGVQVGFMAWGLARRVGRWLRHLLLFALRGVAWATLRLLPHDVAVEAAVQVGDVAWRQMERRRLTAAVRQRAMAKAQEFQVAGAAPAAPAAPGPAVPPVAPPTPPVQPAPPSVPPVQGRMA